MQCFMLIRSSTLLMMIMTTVLVVISAAHVLITLSHPRCRFRVLSSLIIVTAVTTRYCTTTTVFLPSFTITPESQKKMVKP